VLRRLAVARGTVASVAFSTDGRELVTAGDKAVRIWKVADGSPAGTLDARSPVEDAVPSRDGTQVAAGSDDGRVRIWSRRTGRLLHVVAPHRGLIYAVAYSRDGRFLAAGTSSGAVLVLDARTGRTAALLLGHTDFVGLVVFGPDARHLLTASGDGTVRSWDWRARTGAVISTQVVGGASLDLSPDGRWLSVGGPRNTALLLRCLGCLPLDGPAGLVTLARRGARPLTSAERQQYLHAGERETATPY
jgi:WD40 repeat protein